MVAGPVPTVNLKTLTSLALRRMPLAVSVVPPTAVRVVAVAGVFPYAEARSGMLFVMIWMSS